MLVGLLLDEGCARGIIVDDRVHRRGSNNF